jgi:hypothetical protein
MKATCVEFTNRLLSGVALLAALWQSQVSSQTSLLPAHQNEPQTGVTAQAVEMPFIFRVTAREVVIEVVAIDRHNHPVSDLKQNDFRIFQPGKYSRKTPLSISAFHLIDPASPGGHSDLPTAGFQVTSGGGCATATTFHYELAYHPAAEGWTSGYHDILVTTDRPHVVLLYRRHYYVGRTEAPVNMPIPQTEDAANLALQEAACHHLPAPSSISLAADSVQSGNPDSLRYSLIVRADSLAFIALSGEARKVQLDYGVCTFDVAGAFLKFMHTSVERVLEPIEYERALVHGFGNLVEFPNSGSPALVRFVVRDRATGNLGSLDLAAVSDQNDHLNHAKWLEETRERRSLLPQDTGSFGSVAPLPGSLCGDVYELASDTTKLPEYWNLDPIGAVHTYALNVENEFLTKGIPGVTNRPEWFGIDYHGEFWIGQPGEYSFELSSDDGANLYVDGVLVIGLDGGHQPWTGKRTVRLGAGLHTIHLPYFQGPLSVTLVLRVKRPGEGYKIFDLRDFTPPAEIDRE